jgi:hypothetical protein
MVQTCFYRNIMVSLTTYQVATPIGFVVAVVIRSRGAKYTYPELQLSGDQGQPFDSEGAALIEGVRAARRLIDDVLDA